MPESIYSEAIYPEFPFAITVLCYTAVGLLLAILLLLLRMSGQIIILSNRLKKSTRSESIRPSSTGEITDNIETEPETSVTEVGPGTPFEEFLNEDPERRRLSKKEQFKEYRKWRDDKGLNWSK
jgi:hypothetical protein